MNNNYKKDYFVLSKDKFKITKIFMDHCKPLISPNCELYRWRPSEITHIKKPGIRGYFWSTKTKIESGFRDSKNNTIEPLLYEKYMVIDNVVFNAYEVRIDYEEIGNPKNASTIAYYFYNDTEVDTFFDMLIDKGIITNDDIIIKNTTNKKYI